ncbi:uncharacterized protein LOC142099863 isoform X3 [Mixophyes fleayi]|uniref:uncharacterized protein LOC142099863 isoform X2 n=1 Tax=Mixophyes fleayi TaxID=3061075 RepID=UPI003F4DAE09
MARATVCVSFLLLTFTGSYTGVGAVSPTREETYVQPGAVSPTREETYVQPAPNIALRGISTQSSTNSYFGNARNANDGSLANNYLRSQCSYTKKDSGPWWMVDLKGKYKVFSVAITNRVLECCRERIFGAEIRIGNDPSKGGISNPRCGVIASIESGETLSFSCEGMIGQYVTVAIPGREESLVMCEVQVYGVPASSSDEVTVPRDLKTPNGAPNVALQGISNQSSLYNMYGESKNAIDGSLASNYLYIQCTGTNEEDNPWWRVDLKSKFTIFTVTITNRGDCCEERINGAQIRIGNSGVDGGISNPICGIITSMSNGQTLAFQCNGMVGQYVTVFIPGTNRSLSICEVQVFGLPSDVPGEVIPTDETDIEIPIPSDWASDFWGIMEYLDYEFTEKEVIEPEGVNLAFRGISSQSSTYDKFGASENAIDGSLNTRYMSGHCSHTDLDIEPWWKVDLTQVYNVTKVKITNRGDCCKERINGAEIRIGTSPKKGGTRNPRCAKITSMGQGEEQEYICGMVGQYVTVTIPGIATYLTICEMKVYGENVTDDYRVIPYNPDSAEIKENEQATELRNILKHSNAAPNVALTGTTDQSSTDGGVSSGANDGSLSTCAQTNVEQSPWWTLDLKSDHKVFFIAITNKKHGSPEDLDGAEIHVGTSASGWKKNPICDTISSIGLGETFSFNCNGMTGRYVTIVISDKVKSLSVCEVQVFALPMDIPSEHLNEDIEIQKTHGVKNVAPQGIPSQSSFYGSKDSAKVAIDGSLSSNYMAGDCTHTKKQLNPWWKLDLKSKHRVMYVAITNRGDCCRERINGAELRIGNSATEGGISNPRCAVVFRMNYGETMSFNCKGMEGRYMTITIPGEYQFLTVCEVQIFAEPVEPSQEATLISDPTPTTGEETTDTTHSAVNLERRYFSFPEESDSSYIYLSPAVPLSLSAFSLCMKISLDVPENRETILFSYRTLYYDELNLWQEANGKVGLYMRGEHVMFPKLDRSKEWQHLCLTWESRYGRTELWVNGKRSANKVYRRGQDIRPGGLVLLGQDQDELGSGFDKSQSFVGKIKDVNMWNKVLSLKSLRSIFKNKQVQRGNIFDWSALTYSVRGNVVDNAE